MFLACLFTWMSLLVVSMLTYILVYFLAEGISLMSPSWRTSPMTFPSRLAFFGFMRFSGKLFIWTQKGQWVKGSSPNVRFDCHNERFKIAPLTTQGPAAKMLSLSSCFLNVQTTMVLSINLISTFSPRFHAFDITALMALGLILFVVMRRPTKLRLLDPNC